MSARVIEDNDNLGCFAVIYSVCMKKVFGLEDVSNEGLNMKAAVAAVIVAKSTAPWK